MILGKMFFQRFTRQNIQEERKQFSNLAVDKYISMLLALEKKEK